MLYAIMAEDVVDSLSLRAKGREGHIARLNILKEEGRLLLAGPLPAIDSNDPGNKGFTGSLVVAEFENLQVAKDWADDDPYFHCGAYAKVIVKPFKKVLP